MNFLGDNKELVLTYLSMPKMSLQHSSDLLLTPQFYTLKKETLPIKYVYQARRIAPSIFEGMLEEDRAYEYFVYKENDQWVFIAYSLEEITAFLKSKEIEPEKVSKLFFAEQWISAFKKPYLLNEKEVLAVLDDTVVIVPRTAVGDGELNTSLDAQKPSKGISLHSAYTSLLSFPQAVGFAVIFILFAALFFAEGLRYGGNAASGKEELESLIASNPSLESQYTRESIAKKYRTIDTTERKKREAVKTLIGMAYKGVELQELQIDEKRVRASYMIKKSRVRQRMESEAKKANYTVKKITGGIQLEGKL